MSPEYPAIVWSSDLHYRTGMSDIDCEMAGSVDLETYAWVRDRVNAVSDAEWELLCSFEAHDDDGWTHAIVHEEAVEHTETIPSNALFDGGKTKTYMACIFYGTPETLAAHNGKVFTKQKMTAILRVLDYRLIDDLLTPEPVTVCLQATT